MNTQNTNPNQTSGEGNAIIIALAETGGDFSAMETQSPNPQGMTYAQEMDASTTGIAIFIAIVVAISISAIVREIRRIRH